MKSSASLFKGFCLVLLLLTASIAYGQKEKEPVFYTDSSSYDVSFYKLNLNVTNYATIISGYAEIKAKVTNTALKKFYIELTDSLIVDSVIISDKKQVFTHNNGWIKLFMDNPVDEGIIFTTEIYYHGKGPYSGLLGGIAVANVYSSKELYTLSEPFSASDFFPCKQLLTDKADSAFVYLTVPAGQIAASNGLLKSSLKTIDNKIAYKWETRYPIAYYLIAFAVSDFNEYSYRFFDENYGDSILFQNYLYNDSEFINSSKESIDKTVQIIKLFEQLTGVRYPFRKEKYGHVTAPIGGGMENQTLTTLNGFDFILVAHELGHSWFGDMVTCADWQDIWLNEGFASYMEYLSLENLQPSDAYAWLKDAFNSALEEADGTVYVPDSSKWDDSRIFSYNLSYKKGALIIHMLRKKLKNDVLFFNILKTYLETFAYSNARSSDFINISERLSGIDLNQFFQQWYYGEGFPRINFDWAIGHDSLSVKVHNQNSSNQNSIFQFDLEVLVHLENARDTIVKLAVNDTFQIFNFIFPADINSIEVNPFFDLLADIKAFPPIEKSMPGLSKDMEFYAYPNPFTDSTHIHFGENSLNRHIELYDINGNKIAEWNNVEKIFTITSEKLQSGVYIVKAADNEGIYTLKIIKQ